MRRCYVLRTARNETPAMGIGWAKVYFESDLPLARYDAAAASKQLKEPIYVCTISQIVISACVEYIDGQEIRTIPGGLTNM